MFAIDRSDAGVDRTKARCAEYVEAGRLTVPRSTSRPSGCP